MYIVRRKNMKISENEYYSSNSENIDSEKTIGSRCAYFTDMNHAHPLHLLVILENTHHFFRSAASRYMFFENKQLSDWTYIYMYHVLPPPPTPCDMTDQQQ